MEVLSSAGGLVRPLHLLEPQFTHMLHGDRPVASGLSLSSKTGTPSPGGKGWVEGDEPKPRPKIAWDGRVMEALPGRGRPVTDALHGPE